MPIPQIDQPEVICVDEKLRLRKFDDQFDFALEWYQDEETNYMVDGRRGVYDRDQLARMYNYLEKRGEVYFIEIQDGAAWRPIGDVSFWQEDMPIVIGEHSYRGQGIGKKVISALIQRGKSLGYSQLLIGEIYDWNEPSRRCFESLGFLAYEKTEKGSRYRLELTRM